MFSKIKYIVTLQRLFMSFIAPDNDLYQNITLFTGQNSPPVCMPKLEQTPAITKDYIYAVHRTTFFLIAVL